MKTTRITNEPAAATPCAFSECDELAGERGQRSRWYGMIFFAAVVSLALLKPLYSFLSYAASTSLNSHILLVPFISGYLIYLQKATARPRLSSSALLGLPALLVGASSLVASFVFQSTMSPEDFHSCFAYSWVTLLISGAFFFLGRAWMWSVCFPIGFLYFMVPLPDAAVHGLETMLKLGSAEVAGWFLEMTGTPVVRDGVIFQLPNITLEVAQECSGIRSSWILLMTSVVASYLLLQSPVRRGILLAIVLPLAILRNGFRILVIGLLCVHFGPQMIHSVIHESGGPLFFALSLLPLFVLLWWLRKGEAPAWLD